MAVLEWSSLPQPGAGEKRKMATIYLGDKHAVKMPEHGAAAEIGLTFRMQYLEIIIATVSSLQGSV